MSATEDAVRQQAAALAQVGAKIQDDQAKLAQLAPVGATVKDLIGALTGARAAGGDLAARRARVAELTRVRDSLRAGRSS